MRWERLFADLEAQYEAAGRDDLAGEVADRTRREVAQITLADRLRAARGTTIELHLAGGHVVFGPVGRTGPGWALIAEDDPAATLVATAAITEIRRLGVAAAPPPSEVAARLDLAHILRAIARDRTVVSIGLVDGRILSARIDRVGRDFVDVSNPSDDRDQSTTSRRTLTFSGLAVIRL